MGGDGSEHMKFLSSETLNSEISMLDIVTMVEDAYREEGKGRVVSSPRNQLRSEETHTFFNVLPCLLPKLGVVGVNTYTGGNKGAPLMQKVILLFSSDDGGLLAILEADWISWMRTGASSGVATKFLAKEDASRVGIFGSGRQARSQLWAVSAVRELTEALVYSPNQEHRENYASDMSEKLGIEVCAVDSADAVLEQSEIICTATTSHTPVFDGGAVAPGTHVNVIGQHYPDRREVDTKLISKSKLVVDDRERAWQEDGELLIPLAEKAIDKTSIHGSLGEVVAKVKAGREGDEITLFSSGGIASEVLAVAAGVYRVAEENGLGQEIEWNGPIELK